MTLGCGTPVIEIGALEPVPAVRRAAGIAVPTLVLEGTPDALRIEGAGFPAVEIRSFRSTLTAGFARGFGRPAPAGKAGAILFLEVTRVFLAAEPPPDGAASAAQDRGAELLLAHGTHAFKQVGAPRRSRRFAVIEFEATLRDRGVEVSRIAGRAVSDRAAGPDPVEVGHALSSAVAAMYQRIDRALFARRMAHHDASDEARDDVAGPRPWLFPVGTMTECDGYFDVEHDDAADCAADHGADVSAGVPDTAVSAHCAAEFPA